MALFAANHTERRLGHGHRYAVDTLTSSVQTRTLIMNALCLIPFDTGNSNSSHCVALAMLIVRHQAMIPTEPCDPVIYIPKANSWLSVFQKAKDLTVNFWSWRSREIGFRQSLSRGLDHNQNSTSLN
jgi:hypothetical protein